MGDMALTSAADLDSTSKNLTDYPRPSVAVDTALLTVPDGSSALQVLLVQRAGSHEHGLWALPGAFLHDGERLACAVLRSLRDKAGVNGLEPHQLRVFDELDRDDRGRVLSVAHLVVVPWARIAKTVTARHDVHLRPVADAVSLPFDHDAIVALAVAELRARYRSVPDPDRLLRAPFSLLQLRRLHEAVLARALPKDTFRRAMQPQLKATTEYQEGQVGKPALLFRHSRPRRAPRASS
jgi:8-oxo-dGTP diphosphatase